MKILHVIPNLFKGGAQRLVIDTCNELSRKKNLQCKLVVLSKTINQFEYISKGLDIEYCEVSLNLRIFRKNKIQVSDFEHIVDVFNPDIIHSHLYFSELVTHQNIRKNTKYVTHFHYNIEQFQKLNFKKFSKTSVTNYFEKKRIYKLYNKATKTFIAISKDNYKYVKSVLPNCYGNNIYLLENAINISNFKPSKNDNFNMIKLINIGNFIENKNQIFLIDVVKYIHDKGIKVSLELIGDGIYKEKVYLKAKEMNILSKINFRGSVNDVGKYLSCSNIYIHSALIETFGLVLIEAMASKVPVVSLNGKGNQDLVINEETGILINELNPKIFGDKIINLFKDKTRRDKLINNAFEFSKKFNITRYTNNLIKIYSNNVV